MNAEGVVRVIHALGQKVTGQAGEWLHTNCPFAFATHSSGMDNNPSFGIEVNAVGQSRFNCFSCDTHGQDLLELVFELKRLKKIHGLPDKVNLPEVVQLISLSNEDKPEALTGITDYNDLIEAGKKKKYETVFYEEKWLSSFLPGVLHPYLKERDIPEETAIALDLRYDFAEKRICFPMRDFAGRLVGLQGRSIEKNPSLRYKLYSCKGKYNPHVWAGENLVTLEKPLVLTEGFFDLAKIYQVYPNVLASLTSMIIPAKFKRIRDIDRVITFYDFGTGGNAAREKVEKYFAKSHTIVEHIIPSEEEGDAGAMTLDEIRFPLEELL